MDFRASWGEPEEIGLFRPPIRGDEPPGYESGIMPRIDVTDESIPDEIRTIQNWICWREGERDGKATKIPTKPYRTSGDINLDVTNPDQRRDFDTAWDSFNDSRVNADGLGFVFTDDVSIVGVDLDKCRDPDNGVIEEWAEALIDRFNSYTEVSPSGTGVHILVGGELPPGGNRKGRVEMYDSDRYFTVTGAHVNETPTEIRKCQESIEAVHHEFIQGGVSSDGQKSLAASTKSDTSESDTNMGGRRDTEPPARQSVGSLIDHYGDASRNIRDPAIREALERVATKYLPSECPHTFSNLAGPGVDLSDQEILKRMFSSKGGDRKQRLYEGDSSMWGSPDTDYPSQSEADMALVHTLAFWTGKDPDRMNALFKQSGLYREKWDHRHYASGATYGDVAIARALLRVDDYYELPSEDGVKFSKANSSSSSGGKDDGDLPPMDFGDGPALGPSLNPSPSSSPGGHALESRDASQDAPSAPGASDTSDGVPETAEAATGVTGPLHENDTNGEAAPADADVLSDLLDDEEFIPVGPDEEAGDAAAAAEDYASLQRRAQNGQQGHGDASAASTPDASDPTTAGATSENGTGTGDAAGATAGPGTAPIPDGAEPASRRGTDTDPDLDESTQRMMEESARTAGPAWERTNPHIDDEKKHPADWTVGPIEGRTPTAQAMRLAREDNRVLARYQNRLEERIARLNDVEEERDRYKFTAETYLKAMDELMGERERYRNQLKRAGLLSPSDAELPDDPVKRLKQILRPMVRREDVRTAKEALTGLDAVLREYEETNERIQAEERERRQQQGLRGKISRFFG